MLLNLRKRQRPDVENNYLFIKDPFKFIGREKVGIYQIKTLRAFINYSQTIDDVYENLEDYNSTHKKEKC